VSGLLYVVCEWVTLRSLYVGYFNVVCGLLYVVGMWITLCSLYVGYCTVCLVVSLLFAYFFCSLLCSSFLVLYVLLSISLRSVFLYCSLCSFSPCL
jgi:hypothetical protein